MKKVLLLVTVLLMTTTAFAQDKNARATIEVDGICGMCKQRIERASLNTKGVKSAVWSVETHQLSLIYDERKTDLATIQQNIANVGHDTHEIKATEEAYNSVHDCCKYRDEEIKDAHGKKDNR
ncbi:MAG: ATPase [Altibacter sp.]|uniref:heavy-metal-associated domain-containing protein n=1 Tax=Altibacter sp. TaxID=2024823 RepID=UPI000C8FAD30|nr:heavy-metal-associated domain-containing protein [Altibacter sp.]MAP53537.1 ATPase [Altibacter sp.]